MEQAIVDTDLDARLEEAYARQPAAPLVKAPTPENTSFKDRYETVERLGDGSQGHVFRVKEVATEDTYILKKILVPFDQNEVVKENVQREVQSLRRLNHPAIPQLVGYEVEQNPVDLWEEHFLLMEDNGGTSLDKKWNNYGPFSEEQVKDIESQCLAGLAHAHSQGVLHRDVKPGNVLINEKEEVTIIDWGVAKFDTQKTRIGTLGVVGTPGYMAPEQMGGEGSTCAATDLYSLAATLIAARRGEDIAENAMPEDLVKMIGEEFSGDQHQRLESMIEKHPQEREKKWKVEGGSYVCLEPGNESEVSLTFDKMYLKERFLEKVLSLTNIQMRIPLLAGIALGLEHTLGFHIPYSYLSYVGGFSVGMSALKGAEYAYVNDEKFLPCVKEASLFGGLLTYACAGGGYLAGGALGLISRGILSFL